MLRKEKKTYQCTVSTYDDDNDDDVFKIVCQRKQIDFYVRGVFLFEVAGCIYVRCVQ